MWENELSRFVKNLEEKFENYFVGFGAKKLQGKYKVNVFMDDRDIRKMTKKDLYKALQKHIDKVNDAPNKIKAKPVLVSDINETNVWKFLGDFSQIMDVKSMITFVNVRLPEGFQEAFERLPEKFKLEDLRRELKKITKKDYHRNTYQNWLRFLKKAEFIKLKNKNSF